MGIRVHKMIGYGLTDLTVKEYGQLSDDDRFNPDSFFLMEDKDERDKRFNITNLVAQLSLMCGNSQERSIELGMLLRDVRHGDFKKENYRQLLTHDTEFGISHVAVFTPPVLSEGWKVYDGQVDYHEETVVYKQKNRYVELKRPIYPYEGWLDLRTDPPTRCKMDVGRLRMMIDDPGYFGYPESSLCDDLATTLGFDCLEDVRQNVVPMIPEDLVFLLEFLRVFKDPKTIYELRPILYVHWG